MAYQLVVDKLEDDGTILVRHTFFGETEDACYHLRDAHAAGCKAFGPAVTDQRIIEEMEKISEIPEWEDDDDES